MLQPIGEPPCKPSAAANSPKAKNIRDTAPVCITDRGEPAYVLMNYAAYKALSKHPQSNAERLGMSIEDLEIVGEVEFPRCPIVQREVDF